MLRQGEGSVEIREGKAPPSLKIRDQKTPKTRHFACSGSFLAELGQERRNGTISPDTEQRVKLAFRTLGRDAPDAALAAAVGAEIDRLERDATVLRKLRSELGDAQELPLQPDCSSHRHGPACPGHLSRHVLE